MQKRSSRKRRCSQVRASMRERRAWPAVIVLALFTCASATFAAQFPVKPVRLVTPYPPGGGTDAVARPVAASFSKAWGQPIVVDNRGGGGGVIAAQMVANAPPDGYTLFLSTGAVMVSAPLVMGAVGYDPYKDFKPVGLAALLPAILVAQASLPANSVQDVIALARASPGKLTFSSSGTGGGHHFAVEMLKSMAGRRRDPRAVPGRRARDRGVARRRGSVLLRQHPGRAAPSEFRQVEGDRGGQCEANVDDAAGADAHRIGIAGIPVIRRGTASSSRRARRARSLSLSTRSFAAHSRIAT